MNRSSAIAWVNQYLLRLTDEGCGSGRIAGLHLKAIGEYALLLSLIRQFSPEEWQELIKFEVTRCIASEIKKMDLRSSQLKECQLAHFLDQAFSQDTYFCAEKYRIISRIDNECVSIEHAFLMESVGLYVHQSYWLDASLQFLRSSECSGIGTSEFYQLTHLVFFSTQFGMRDIPIPKLVKRALYCLVTRAIDHALTDKNCDLLAEVCISAILLDNKFSKSTRCRRALELLGQSQSAIGWFLSDYSCQSLSTDLSFNIQNEWIAYSLFHTTCVCILLDTVLTNSPTKRRTRRRRLHPSQRRISVRVTPA